MNNSPQSKPANDKSEANKISTIQEDNEVRPLDKTEGRMNNGETGGATDGDSDEKQPESNA